MNRFSRTAAAALSGWFILGWIGLGWGGGCRSSTDSSSATGNPPIEAGGVAPVAGRRTDNASSAREKTPAKPVPSPSIRPVFTEVARDSGVDFTFYNDAVPDRYFLPEIMGGGTAWLDYDGDGLLDLILADGCALDPASSPPREPQSRLYRNLGDGKFVDATAAGQLQTKSFGQGCAVGDYDADGFPDLFVATYGPDLLFHNQGDGTLQLVTAEAGASDDLWSSSAVWLDADQDGDLDLYVVNYMAVTLENKKICEYDQLPGYCGPGEYQAVPDRLWLNQGDGTFIDGLEAQGMAVPKGKGLAITVLDLDGDLRPEIYVANDMEPNFLFTRGDSPLASSKTEAPGRPWAEVGLAAGCAVSGMGLNEASMGVSVADFDGDGLPDIYLTHYYNAKNTFYRNLGGLTFIDDSFRSRSAANSIQSLGFGTVPVDFDRDGAMDIFVANGHVLGPKISPYEMAPQLLWNEGTARFWDVSTPAGAYFREKWLGRSAAGGDYDNDGDLDIVVSHLHRPVALLRNDTVTGRHFLGLDLRTHSRIPPLGGRVVVEAGTMRRTLPIQAGGSYLASPDRRLLCGLGDQEGPVRVEIHWPSGEVQTIEELRVDRYWTIYPGQSPVPSPGSTRP